MLDDDHCEKDYPKIIDIGSCSLLVLHGAFKSGVEATDQFLNEILKAMLKIFDALWQDETPILRFVKQMNFH